ncbi:hypothetical protein WR25_07763 [Diploscapter pachys]|uniref:RNA helicase n=1 Tax=Diploscapter pachys TaxID=2018661 RepID=A0A2A2LAE3_9BILA|nr:hypothetical protein WR25_07763 [Diploscapter pachys]
MGGKKRKVSTSIDDQPDADSYATAEFDGSNALVLPGKRKKSDPNEKSKKPKDPTGGKKKRNYAKEKAKERITKKMKRQLAAVQRRKQVKMQQEDIFKSLAEYQLDDKKMQQLTSVSRLQKEHKITDEEPAKQGKLKTFSGGLQEGVNKRKQENYYSTDEESTSEEEGGEETDDDVQIVKEEVREKAVEVEKQSEKEKIKEPEPETSKTKQNVEKSPSKIPRKSIDDDEVKAELADEHPSVFCPKRQTILVARTEEIQKKRSQLPIFSEEMNIVEAINDNLVTIVCGETGSGKTTQIPQFLYEAGYASDGQMIGITEPRRVAAVSMAERVGEELNRPDIVSYQIRYEGNRSEKTKILFMTDGVLLKELETDMMLNKYSAIIIDEAHERSMYSDVLLGMLSRIVPLRQKSAKPLRLVVMSATLRLDDFTHPRLFLTPPKVLKVDARQFPVTVHFERHTPTDYMAAAFRKVCSIHEKLPKGAILVFVTGQREVQQLVNKLTRRYEMKFEETKLGEKLIVGGKKWKQKKKEETKDFTLEKFKDEIEREEMKIDGKDLDEKGLVEDMWSDCEEDEEEQDLEENLGVSSLGPPPSGCEPLYCLPLYSLLSTEKQKRVFEKPPEGVRLCVVSTNVAETSLTIPGVKYVIDCGFEKRRLYDPVTGVSKFAICRTSQASADQRAGRAGRVSAGHAYRLFSSAVFQDLPKFAEPEIVTKPVDQLVLNLKAINIVKVVNFPFPTPPSAESVEKAEERLLKLGALERTTKNGKTEARINSLGRSLSAFPLAPEYAKMLVMANQHGLLPYVILLIAALSVREPLIPVSSVRGETSEETKAKMTSLLVQRKQWCGKGVSRRLGDVKVLMQALHNCDRQNNSQKACETNFTRPTAAKEARRLRQQLTNLVNGLCKPSQQVLLDPQMDEPTDSQSNLIRQILVACLCNRIAKRVNPSSCTEEVPKGAYHCQHLEQNGKQQMRTVCGVDAEWLPRLAESFCSFSEQNQDDQPEYDAQRDEIVRPVDCWFGPRKWQLERVKRPLSHDIQLYRYFAMFLLNGEIFKQLAEFTPKLLAPPATMIRSWAKLQKRTEALLNKLIDKQIHTRPELKAAFVEDENFLLEEYFLWLPESLHSRATLIWPPLEEHEKPRKMGRNKKF